jgi:murein DD-endopeptidase MepM/ murein hydrolase activator NlpD
MPHAVTPEPETPWWTSGWVGGSLVAGVAAVVFAAGVEVVVPMLDVSGPATDTVLVAEHPPAPSYRVPPLPKPTPSETPSPQAPASDPAPAAPAEPAATPDLAAQARKAERAARLRRERRAARELAVVARQTFATWGPVSATWVLPVASYRLSAHYGQTGPHWETIHTGQDFSAPTGTPVRAATAGIVTFASWDGPYGNKIEITHPDGLVTWYAHLSRSDVSAGDTVSTGQQIGLVGSTGNSTGPHLHFEVHPGEGDAVDPVAVLAEHGQRV